MKKIFLAICFLVLAVISNAQSSTFQWAKRIGGSSTDFVSSICVDLLGNVYTAGNFSGTVDFDPGIGVFNLTSSGFAQSVFVLKIDSLGNFIWAKKMGGLTPSSSYAKSISIDTFGNVYTTGKFNGTIDFDPELGVYDLTAGPFVSDLFISKLDSVGNFVWAKSVGGTDSTSTNEGYSIAIDNEKNVYTTGYFQGIMDFDPGLGTFFLDTAGGGFTFVLKLDSLGNFVWAKKLGGFLGYALTLDSEENVYTTGVYGGTVDFDPGLGVYNLISSTPQNIFISKLDSAGNFMWAKSIGGGVGSGSNIGREHSIKVDLDGNVFTVGYFQGTVDFDPGIGTFNITSFSGSSNSTFVSKLDSLGNFVWAKSIQGSYNNAESITLDVSGNIFIIGSFQTMVDFDPGAGIFNLIPAGTYDIFILALDTLGNFVWAGNMGGSADDGGVSIASDGLGNVYTTGVFQGTADFDSGVGLSNLISSGGNDIFIHKLHPIAVWPGDADHNCIADNFDLLPIGLFYGQAGNPRATVSNTWQAYNSTDWGILQPSGADIKHIDCNGDGIIDNNDTLAVNLNFSLTHALAPINNEYRLSGPDLYFVTSSSSYLSGSIVDVEVWLGNSTTPLSNLYGIAFDINYDASLVQPVTESLTYPLSWLGTPGTDAITIAKIDAVGNTVYGAETRIDQINSSGFGKIADFKFQLKSSIPANTPMIFSISSYSANDSNGNTVLFNASPDTIVINSTASIAEINNEAQISIYPNPTNGTFNVFTSQQIKPARPAGGNGSIEIYNSIGELILSQKITNQQNTIDLKNQASGLYFVKVISDGEVIGMKKVVKE